MRVLITGGAGFVGSHVVDLLAKHRHEVFVVDDLSTGTRQNLNSAAQFVCMDVRQPVEEVFQSFRPEVVVHLAAQVSVPRSTADPYLDVAINVGGTIQVMEAAARAGARKVVTVSSAAVYGNPFSLPIREENPTNPLSPYGLSKLTAEHYVRLLCRTRGMAFTILRPSNLYGPRQKPERDGAVVASLLSDFLAGKDPVIHGDGSQTRDFLHVADMAQAISQALIRGDGETLNVSSGAAISVRALWDKLALLLGWQRAPLFGPPRSGDILHSWMSNDRAYTVLGWAPTIGLEEGLARTVAYLSDRQATVVAEGPKV